MRALLAERRDAARRLLATLENLPVVNGDLSARLRSATLRKGILEVQSELTWLDELEAAL